MNSLELTSLYDRGDGPSWHGAHRDLFPSEPSLRWFMRRHRDALVTQGALLKLRGSWFVDSRAMTRLLPELLKQDSKAA